MKPGGLVHRVGAAIREHRLWSAGDRVAVAVSGGVDSVALLALLRETAAWHGGDLSVVTVDHAQRPESALDLAFVEALSVEFGLPCRSARLAVAAGADEATLRDARYACFEALDVDVVALGHHADDQVETALINLLRGTRSPSLGAMRWRRGRYVRPLLSTRRTEILAFAEQRGLSWRDDPSNASARFLRNRVRAELIPLIESLRPGASGTIARNCTRLADDAD